MHQKPQGERRLTAEEVLNIPEGMRLIFEAGIGQSNHVKAVAKALTAGSGSVYVEIVEVLETGPDAMVIPGDAFPVEYHELKIEQT